jgi:hypothetical protein
MNSHPAMQKGNLDATVAGHNELIRKARVAPPKLLRHPFDLLRRRKVVEGPERLRRYAQLRAAARRPRPQQYTPYGDGQ